MRPSIAFVGAGPTTIYTLHALLEAMHGGADITIYEAQSQAGLGTPYRPGWNDPAMLSNIASIEIPPIRETLCAWLERQPRRRLLRLGVDPDAIDPHAFYPRVALGAYFQEQFEWLVATARGRGMAVDVVTGVRVTDIRADSNRICLSLLPRRGTNFERAHDEVVLATGHQWPEEPEVKPGYFLSPWPATALQRIPPASIGILGSSLTAIDAAVTMATTHGAFEQAEGEALRYRIDPDADDFAITMISRKGLLPEADFYHPLPYEPLAICTPEAISALIEQGGEDLLDRAFALFRDELAAADPVYAEAVGLSAVTLETFCDRYFAERLAADPFDWAAANLAEARSHFESCHTVPWRYAILRMHETFGLIAPHLDEEALHRFNTTLKPVFVDDYATVPHLSIERMLALHRAGRLEVVALGQGGSIDTKSVPGAVVTIAGRRRHFPAFIDATGQAPLGAEDFPFSTLLKQGVVKDAAEADGAGVKGIVVDAQFHPLSTHPARAQLFCLSIPFLLQRHPFIQGITSSHEIGTIVGTELAAVADAASLEAAA
ncbi:FAD/NAD(P)-binding protein [Sphingomonas sp. TDK1]|uniref:FAD/NAD(P)-binding protein n=1 Tax=Sphingomonas sp. TDK1 TaxID=453247 RepID=UPI0007D96353|nr:FAD/NAD(P)-binding protein [Sphingomonas sp. TDK1]OAN57636.1 FAD-dependent oxidoreductase [Sphingomonas sp. TDK1]